MPCRRPLERELQECNAGAKEYLIETLHHVHMRSPAVLHALDLTGVPIRHGKASSRCRFIYETPVGRPDIQGCLQSFNFASIRHAVVGKHLLGSSFAGVAMICNEIFRAHHRHIAQSPCCSCLLPINMIDQNQY